MVKALNLQKVLEIPCLTTGIAFYKRLLSKYNLTVHNLADNQPSCYVWDETIAGRSSDEISLAIYLDILNFPDEYEHVMYYSNNC